MKILVGIDIHFEGYGGPYYAISNKLHNLNCVHNNNIINNKHFF